LQKRGRIPFRRLVPRVRLVPCVLRRPCVLRGPCVLRRQDPRAFPPDTSGVSAYNVGMELSYTYYEEDGMFIGYFDDFPEHLTQGKTLEELEKMLADLYECLELSKYHKRVLKIA